MNLTISIKDRLLTSMILPTMFRQTSIVDGLILKGLKKKLEITPGEIEELNIRDGKDGQILWDSKKEKPVSFELADREVELLHRGINDPESKVNPELIPAFFEQLLTI